MPTMLPCAKACGSVSALELGDVAELELDRRFAAEDVDEHLELGAVDVDLGDQAVELRERTGDDPDLLADFVLEARPGLLLDGRRTGLFVDDDAEDVLDLTSRER